MTGCVIDLTADQNRQLAEEKREASKSRFRNGWTGLKAILGVGLLLLAVRGVVGVNSLRKNKDVKKPPLSTHMGRDGMTLLYVPAGTFSMGSVNGNHDEKPVHTVYLEAFWIDQTEVTNAMYVKCAAAEVCDEPISKSSVTRNDYYGASKFDNYPVIYVTWEDASAYCTWAGRRLPTEAEWEKAARGENGFTYPWGNDTPDNNLLNYNSHMGDTVAVGSYPQGASPYGALDLAGNVWEWVSDWYASNYYQGSPVLNPQGPASGRDRVLRGGSWYFYNFIVRSANRGRFVPTSSYNDIGFRCAMSDSK